MVRIGGNVTTLCTSMHYTVMDQERVRDAASVCSFCPQRLRPVAIIAFRKSKNPDAIIYDSGSKRCSHLTDAVPTRRRSMRKEELWPGLSRWKENRIRRGGWRRSRLREHRGHEQGLRH